MRLIIKKAVRTVCTLVASAFILTTAFADESTANSKYAAFVIDHNTGKVLFARNADAPRYPASLTKIMTLYMVFDRLETGQLKLNTPMKVSSFAASRPPSKIGLKVGSTITVENAIKALVTKSANDVAVVIAEHIGGSEANFAKMMTERARQIGMAKTTFRNASGLPNTQQITTARDMSTLGRSIMVTHPDYYGYFNTRVFTYRGSRYGNHNRLLGRVEGVDGIKTGYTRASGFNLVTSLNKNGRHMVGVVMGGKTGASRNAHMTEILQAAYGKASIDKKPNVSPVVIASAPLPPQINRPDPNSVIGNRFVQAASIESIISSLPKQYADKQPVAEPVQLASNSSDLSTIISRPVQAQSFAAPQAASTGWKIQIGAFDSANQAAKQLDNVQNRMTRQLAGLAPVTEEFNRGDTMFYRARFAGFDSQQQAQDACSALKKQRIACYAVYE